MKTNKKKNKRKTFSYYYRKWGSRRCSSRPLSQLLLIGSFKKRIGDLSKNNSLLSNALQESLVESAHQSNILKSYAKDYNQILFARIKLNEMARNLAKFATDLEEVRNCLAIDHPVEYNFFQKKGSSNERIIKSPDVSCIDEVPELSENEVETCENSGDFHSNSVENVNSAVHDIHMTSILHDDDDDNAQDMSKKSSSNIYKESLTPELKIESAFVTTKRSTISKRKTSSLGKKSSSGRLISQKKSVSSPPLPQVQDIIEINKIASKDISPVCHIEEESELEIPHQNHSENSISVEYCAVTESSSLNINDEKSVLDVNLNQFFEMNEKVCSLQSFNDEYNSSFVPNFENESEIAKSVKEINENCDELSLGKNDESSLDKNDESSLDKNDKSSLDKNDKFSTERNSQTLQVISQNASLHSIMHEYDEEIQNVGSLTFCESDDDSEKENTASSMIRTSRSRKPLSYADYFSSDESDTDSPFRLSVTKRRNSKKIKLYPATNDNSYEKSSTENAVEISSADVITEISEPDYSVYDLDVSNSKRKGKNSKKKTSSIKPKSKKKVDLPKPLFQKCSVTKLKGGEHKFSKSETHIKLNINISKGPEKLMQVSCINSPGGILKKTKSSISKIYEDMKNETLLNETGTVNTEQNPKQQSMLQTPKRVSFAPTDLVCNFEKMSVSKTIADNKKVRRTSKSAADLTEIFDEDQPKTFLTGTDTSTRKNGVQESNNSVLFDFSADTEMYTIALPLTTQISTIDNISSHNSSSIVTDQTKLLSSRNEICIKKSPETLSKSPKNIKKLSLKENKIVHNVSQCNLNKAEIKAAILFMESPISLQKKPKRKSLFKELSDVNLKENLNFDHSISENKDSLENNIQTNESSSSTALTVDLKKSIDSKCHVTVRSKSSTKKKKRSNLEKKSLEQSPKLIDATNLMASAGNSHSRRRSKQVCYKEPSLNKKLRRQ